MQISSNFDSGNILFDENSATNPVELRIRDDANSEFKQWFHFRVAGTAGVEQNLKITNVNDCSYVEGWTDYQAVASYDRDNWFRVETHYDGKLLTIRHTPEYDSVYYAYFAPYSLDRHMDLLQVAQLSPLCSLKKLGLTVDGRDLDMLHIQSQTGGSAKKTAWIIARQHPGESMAEWCAEGLVTRLLDEDDAIARALLQQWQFYVVPNMNPDGSTRGHLRANAAGANLNREWLEPSMEKSPEVFLVRKLMEQTGCDLFLDVHGDEAIPYTFVAGSEGIPSFDKKMAATEKSFTDELLKASPDFQTEHGYPVTAPGEANLSMASNWVGEQFGSLSLTLEMPFKDHLFLKDDAFGWSPDRSKLLGEALLSAMYAFSKED